MKKNDFDINQKSLSKGFFKLDITVWLAILIMSLGGGLATYLYHFKNPSQRSLEGKEMSSQQGSAPLAQGIYSGNIASITEQCKKMVSQENSLVIFEHGTCVRLVEPVMNHSDSATASLKILSSNTMGFVVKPLNNNDYLIVFNDYLFCWLFATEIASMKEALLIDPRLAAAKDDPLSIANLPNFEKRLGKFARLLLMEDAKTLVVKKVIRAKVSAATPANSPD